jgi:hypothetical protein
MNNQVFTMMKDGTVVSDGKSAVLDLGLFGKIHAHVHIKVAANASQTIQFQHAAINEDGAFDDLGSAVSIAATGNQTLTANNFLRYVRFQASSSISTRPTLSVFVVAKER